MEIKPQSVDKQERDLGLGDFYRHFKALFKMATLAVCLNKWHTIFLLFFDKELKVNPMVPEIDLFVKFQEQSYSWADLCLPPHPAALGK